MKKIGLKMALVAMVFAAGTLGSQAQIGQGGECLGTGTSISEGGAGAGIGSGTCINSDLTEEQQAILQELYTAYRAEIDVLKAAVRATRDFAVKREIWAEMKALRVAHLEEVKALFEEWGIGG